MIRDTRYIFFGTPRFAAIILENLINAGMPPVALVCNPDRPVGRKQVITPPPTKEIVTRHQTLDIRVFQPEDPSLLMSNVSSLMSDFFIVAAYAKILPKGILEIPRLGTIGVHPSLLPKYRGPSPIQSAILAGEKETGVSLFLMDEKLDHGDVVSSIKYQVSREENYKTLEKKLAELAGDLLVETLPKFIKSEITLLPQDEAQATYTKKFTTEDAFVSEEDLAEAISGNSPEKAREIYRKIRALNPEPGVWTLKKEKRVKLLEAKIIDSRLQLTKIQKEGKTPSMLI